MANAKEARIRLYFHCRNYMDFKGKISTKERLAIGWTDEGFQVVCETCGKSIIDIDFCKQKVKKYKEGREYLGGKN